MIYRKMHISPYLRHRHFLAAPVFAFFLAATLFAGSQGLPATVLQADHIDGKIVAAGVDTPFALKDGTYGVLLKGGILRRDQAGLSLENGSVVIASQGLFTLRISDVTLSGFAGAGHVTLKGSSFTVQPLRASMLLGRGEFRLVLPAGREASWTSAAQIPVLFSPDNLVSQRAHIQAQDAASMRDATDLLRKQTAPALPVFDRVPELPAVLDALTFPESDARLTQQTARARLATLQQQLLNDDPAARSLVQDGILRGYLASEDLPPAVMPILLANARAFPSVAALLMEFIRDPDLWMLVSFHDDYRIAAWTESHPVMPPHVQLARWLQLPQTDRAEAVPGRAVAQWGSEVAAYTASLPDPQAFLGTLLRSMEDFRLFAEGNDLPERLERYAVAVRVIAGPYAKALPDDLRRIYARWDAVGAIAPYSEPPPAPAIALEVRTASSSSSIASSAPAIVRFFPADVEARAKKALIIAGGTTTLRTGITAESPGIVRVQNLQFMTPDGAKQFSFTFHVDAKTLSGIHRDGQLFPYPMSLEAFRKWLKGE